MANDTRSADLDFAADLFKAADKMRGGLEPSEYKHVALGLIFLKYISEAFQAMYERLAQEELADPEDPEEYLAENVFWVPEKARWSHIQQNARSENIGKIIDDAMEAIEAETTNETLNRHSPFGLPSVRLPSLAIRFQAFSASSRYGCCSLVAGGG
ncbi:MAG: SAM-dependent DNA methyltransferase, partial [Rhodobacteraceae bacterium]|nr:SAM-dependent DNA methyltransferase [Paracoccaceae bacterium]